MDNAQAQLERKLEKMQMEGATEEEMEEERALSAFYQTNHLDL